MRYKVIHTLRFLTTLEAKDDEEAAEKAKEAPVSWDDYLDLQDIEVLAADDTVVAKEHIND